VEPVELLEVGGPAPVVLSCEHASQRLPPGWTWPDEDRWLVGTHWAWDIGAAEITRGLSARLGAPAVLAGFSRLLVDPNREPGSPTLFRDVADGRPVHLNLGLSEEEKQRRLQGLYEPYHRAFADLALRHRAPVLGVHTFTPVYEGGPPREMEIGVLFGRDEEPAKRLAASLAARGFKVALNEPYSGRDGLIYACETHARRCGQVALELEVRQDVAGDPPRRAALIPALEEAVRACFSRSCPPRGSS